MIKIILLLSILFLVACDSVYFVGNRPKHFVPEISETLWNNGKCFKCSRDWKFVRYSVYNRYYIWVCDKCDIEINIKEKK